VVRMTSTNSIEAYKIDIATIKKDEFSRNENNKKFIEHDNNNVELLIDSSRSFLKAFVECIKRVKWELIHTHTHCYCCY
jgi:hypothetical protein